MPRKKILWLCSWYPSRLEPFSGDFIQRHARAAAAFNDIHVIHLARDTSGHAKVKETAPDTTDGLTEQIIYYRRGQSAWGRFWAHYRWLFLFRKALRNYIARNGKPNLVHVHVPMKAGILAVWLKRRYNLSYLVTEHWGIYNDVAEDKFEERSFFFQFYTKKVFEKAAIFISASKYLAEGVNRLVVKKEFELIPNVADTRLFTYQENTSPVFRFIHVSNMVPLKNAEGILKAFAETYRQHSHAELVMVGDTGPGIRQLASSLNLPEGVVFFRGEVPYEQVARDMQVANCLVLFSNIENSPCVIGEALCCGLPVIATHAGGIPELLDPTNSIQVEPRNEQQLTNAMLRVIRNYATYNRKQIAENAAARFSFETAGKRLDAIYDSLLAANR